MRKDRKHEGSKTVVVPQPNITSENKIQKSSEEKKISIERVLDEFTNEQRGGIL